MAVEKGDFVELDYTGKLKGTQEVFDTTDLDIAKKAGMKTEGLKFGPVIAKVGSRIVLPGVDDSLIGKDIGSFTVEIPPEKAFGKKDPKLIQLVATSKFTKQKVRPYRGLQLNIDGQIGTIRSVTGGRTIVDFNHPLSGKQLVYDVTIKRIITDKKEMCHATFEWIQFMPKEWDVKDDICTIMVNKAIPDDVLKTVGAELKKYTGVDLKFKLRSGSDQAKKDNK